LLNHEWGLTIFIVGGAFALWRATLAALGCRWDDPSALLPDVLFGTLAIGGLLGQIRCTYHALRQPSRFVLRDCLLEVHWRAGVRRYKRDEIAVGEVGEIPIPYYKGVRVMTPDGSFYVTRRLRHFDRFVALLREGSGGGGGD
jgi:hypothetical protein